MILELKKLALSEGKVEKKTIPYDHKQFEINSEQFEIVSDNDIQLTLSNIEKGKVNVEGSFAMDVSIPCDRCLSPVICSVSAEFSELVDTAEDGDEFDLDEILHRELVMNWPMKVLCQEECKGICPTCGCDLNKTSCDCDNTVLDPRMAQLLDVFNASKES